MRSLRRCLVALTAAGALLVPAAAAGAAGFEAAQPFPTNLLTVADPSQPTGLHVALPTPDCATNPTDCADLAVIDGLDGFNLQPRISVPFSAPIDLATVSSSTIRLYDTSCLVCAPVGIDQVEWEPAANRLHFESDSLLKEGTTYLLVVTTGVRSGGGTPLRRTTFLHDLNFGQTKDAAAKAYRKSLKAALDAHRHVRADGGRLALHDADGDRRTARRSGRRSTRRPPPTRRSRPTSRWRRSPGSASGGRCARRRRTTSQRRRLRSPRSSRCRGPSAASCSAGTSRRSTRTPRE